MVVAVDQARADSHQVALRGIRFLFVESAPLLIFRYGDSGFTGFFSGLSGHGTIKGRCHYKFKRGEVCRLSSIRKQQMHHRKGPVDILRLTSLEAAKIAGLFHEAKEREQSRRRYERVRLQLSTRAIFEVFTICTPNRFEVIPFDLSEGGVGLFHGRFEYPNTPCSVELEATDGELFKVEGVVRRCEMLRGRVHEVGIEFRELFNLEAFLGDKKKNEEAELSYRLFRQALQTTMQGLDSETLVAQMSSDDIARLSRLVQRLAS